MRYQFYREHKYVSAALNDVERLIAKTDFSNVNEIKLAKEEFNGLVELLKGHAHYENERLHKLLSDKHSKVHEHAEHDHASQDRDLEHINSLFDEFAKLEGEDESVALGYQLYLTYRKFVADNLAHLHEEETIILPELQRLYTDEELKQVEADTYRIMTPEQLVEMMQVLFPHMNPSDRHAFLADVHDIQPEKFTTVWELISQELTDDEVLKMVGSFDKNS